MKQLLWIAAFLTLSFVGDRLFGHFFKKTTQNSEFRYSRLYRGDAKADILLVGNSRGLGFYQPEIEKLTGLNTLNISYNGMPADLASVLVRDQFEKNGAPKTMIIDVTMCDRKDDLLVSGFNLYSPYSDNLKALIKGYDETVYYGGLVSHLYRHNSEIFQRAFNYRNKTDKDWLLDRVISAKMASDTNLKSYKVRVMPEMVDHLKQMVDFAKSQGTEVKLVISPYFPRFAESIRDSFLTPLKTLVEAKTGLTVTDYSTALNTTDAFGDYQHANKKGCIQFMNQLFEAKMFHVVENPAKTVETVQGTSTQPSDSTVGAMAQAVLSPAVVEVPIPATPVPAAPVNTIAPPLATESVEIVAATKRVGRHPKLIATFAKRKKGRVEDDYGSGVDTLMLNR